MAISQVFLIVLIPTILGAAVATLGVVLRTRKSVQSATASSIIAFGLAHILLGAIDLVEHR